MSISNMHIMKSNQRLIRQVEKDLFDDAEQAWVRIYASFCKRHADLNRDSIMQFKFKGEVYKLIEDVSLRSGVKPLHKELESEFKEVYAMFVTELETEKRVLKNMLSHAFRIAKYSEDLIDLLPEIMHESINEAGFFQADHKPFMSVDQAAEFKAIYEKHFDLFDLRKTVGSIM